MRVMRVPVAFAMVAALSMASCGGDETGSANEAPASDPTTVSAQAPVDTSDEGAGVYEMTPDWAYADEVLLDVYRPTAEGPWPVVVFAPGLGATKEVATDIGKSYAENGAVAYLITMTDDSPYLETVEDVACAVRYARATAPDHGGDPENVTLVGFSLGAAAGATVGLSGDDHTNGCVETDTSALPDAFVGYEGSYDWAGLERMEQGDPETWAAIDPYAHIGENPDLVVRLIHGVDEGSGVAAEEFQRTLQGAGYDVELIFLDGAGHTASTGSDPFVATVEQALIVAESI